MTNSRVATLTEFLTEAEIKLVSVVTGNDRPHPVHLLLEREDGRSQHRANVDSTLTQVSFRNRSWLGELKPRILQKNHSNASAALAELRAYGSLLEAGFSVKPVPVGKKATPEFLVTDGSVEFVVEVHAKQQNSQTENELAAMRKTIREQKPTPGEIITHVTEVHPWARPKKEKRGDSTTLNAISKICAIKGKEHQLRSDIPSIVWMDFQDLYSWDMALTADQFEPILSFREHLTSGALYYAFYGWNSAPVYEQLHYSHLELPSQIQWMRHDGRFLRSRLTSAVIVSLPTATILAETPRAARQLPSEVRLRCLGLPHFGMHNSIAEWTPGLVARVVAANAKLICGLVEKEVPAEYLAFLRGEDVSSEGSKDSPRMLVLGAAVLVGLAATLSRMRER
jgi:hypothetical protein